MNPTDALKDPRVIWLARAIAIYLLWVNVQHQQIDIGDNSLWSWSQAIAFESAISVCASAVVFFLVYSSGWARIVVPIIGIIALLIGADMSVEASTRAYLKTKKDAINVEEMGLSGTLKNNDAIAAAQRLKILQSQGNVSGVEYDEAVRQKDRAAAAYEEYLASDNKAVSTTAEAMEETGTTDHAVARKRAYVLLFWVIFFAVVGGVWSAIKSAADRDIESFLRGTSEPKKPAGRKPSSPKTAKKNHPAPAAVLPPVLPPKPVYKRPKTAKELAVQVMKDLPIGRVLDHIHKRSITDTLGTRDLWQYSKKSTTQQRIQDELVELGVVVKQPGRAAKVTKEYQYKPPPKKKGFVSSGEVYLRDVDDL